MTDYFAYNPGTSVVPEGHFKISPSRLSKFLDTTASWYRECVLGEEAMFTGSTASYLGTCVHGIAARYDDLQKSGEVLLPIDHEAVEAFIDSIDDPEVNKDHIRYQYPIMAQALIDQYTSQTRGESEEFFYQEVIPGFGVGGSIDRITLCDDGEEEVVDYKTTSDLSAPTRVKREYYFQLMAYVWLLRAKGRKVKRFRIVYVTTDITGRISETTGKPLKDYPTTVTSIVHEVTNDDMELIDGVLRLVAESVKAFKEKPELRHLLAQDMRMKVRTSSSIFKKQP